MPDNLKQIPPGRWRPVRRGGDWTAIMVCPECGRDIALTSVQIDVKGIVYPAVRCPWDRNRHPELRAQMDRDDAMDCNFYASVRLEEWPPSALNQTPEQAVP